MPIADVAQAQRRERLAGRGEGHLPRPRSPRALAAAAGRDERTLDGRRAQAGRDAVERPALADAAQVQLESGAQRNAPCALPLPSTTRVAARPARAPRRSRRARAAGPRGTRKPQARLRGVDWWGRTRRPLAAVQRAAQVEEGEELRARGEPGRPPPSRLSALTARSSSRKQVSAASIASTSSSAAARGRDVAGVVRSRGSTSKRQAIAGRWRRTQCPPPGAGGTSAAKSARRSSFPALTRLRAAISRERRAAAPRAAAGRPRPRASRQGA